MIFGLCALAGPPSSPAQFELPINGWRPPLATINRLPAAPQIDGTFDSREWAGGSVVALHWGRHSTDARDYPVATSFKAVCMGHTDEGLYLSITLDGSNGEDRLMVWLDPDDRGLSAVGFSVDAEGNRQMSGRGLAQLPEVEWQSAVALRDGVAQVEMAIPWSVWPDRPTPGHVLSMNLAVCNGAALEGRSARREPPAIWRWTDSAPDPGFPGGFGEVALSEKSPWPQQLEVALQPGALSLTGQVAGLDGLAGAAEGILELWRDGSKILDKKETFEADTYGIRTFSMELVDLAPDLYTIVFFLVDAGTGRTYFRSPSLLAEVPETVDYRDAMRTLTRRAREVADAYESLDIAQAHRYRNDMARWNGMRAQAQTAVDADRWGARGDTRTRFEELDRDLQALAFRMKRYPVVPAPVELTPHSADYVFAQNTVLHHSDNAPSARMAAQLLTDVSERLAGARFSLQPQSRERRLVVAFGGERLRGVPRDEAPDRPGACLVWANEDSAGAIGADSEGLWLGTRTLLQILHRDGRGRVSMPGVTIRDWPAFAIRAVAIDPFGVQPMDRDQMTAFIDAMAEWKCNFLFLHCPANFFIPQSSPTATALRRDDLIALSAHARQRFIDLIPIVPSVGALAGALDGEHAELREHPDNRAAISPTHGRTPDFLNTRLGYAIPFFGSTFVHLGGRGGESLLWGGVAEASRRLVSDEGAHALLARHFGLLHDLAWRRNKVACFWADALLARPEALQHLDRQSLLLIGPNLSGEPWQPALARAADLGFPVAATVELLAPQPFGGEETLDALDSAAWFAHRRGLQGFCLSLVENADRSPLDSGRIALSYGIERMGAGPAQPRSFLMEKFARVHWQADAADVVAACVQPPALGGAAAGRHVGNLLTVLSAPEAWVYLNRMDNRDNVLREAQATFTRTQSLIRKMNALQERDFQGDPVLDHGRWLLRLNRHGVTKLLALHGAAEEYGWAYGQFGDTRTLTGAAPPDAVMEALRRAETHSRALMYDYPYFEEMLEASSQRHDIDHSARRLWMDRGAVAASQLYGHLSALGPRTAAGGLLPSPTGTAIGPVGAPRLVATWPLSAVSHVGRGAPERLGATARLEGSSDKPAYAIWLVRGPGAATVSQTRVLSGGAEAVGAGAQGAVEAEGATGAQGAQGATGAQRARRTLAVDRVEMVVSAAAPRVMVWRPDPESATQDLWIEAEIAAVEGLLDGELQLLVGRME